jgi:hypothetical protein
VDGQLLRQVNVFKYLGFLLTAKLSPSAHKTRATERARAAAAVITSILKKLQVFELKRLKMYLTCFVESQFYGLELMPVNVLDGLCSARSAFVKLLFDLPRCTSHELAVILFDARPPEIVMMRRILSFVRSLERHDFQFVRDAWVIDRESLATVPNALYCSMVRLVRKFQPSFSPSSDDVLVAMNRIVFASGSSTFNFNYLKFSDSPTLTFFVLFRDVSVLESFRAFLGTRTLVHTRLVILFCSSTLRFRFCTRPRDLCPLCGRPWLWEHFFQCRFLDVAPGLNRSVDVLRSVSAHVASGDWEVFLSYMRFYLLQWCDLVHDPIIPMADIDSLIL